MCRFRTSWHNDVLHFKQIPDVLVRLKDMEKEGLVHINSKSISITKKG